MLKNRYRDEYFSTSYLDAKGRVVRTAKYVGDFYVLPFDQKTKNRYAAVNLTASLLLLGVFFAGGMCNQDSSHTAWIVFPYLFVFLPLGYLLIGAVSFWGASLRMERAAYEGSLRRILYSCRGAMMMAAVSAVLDILYMILYHGEIRMGQEMLYLVCHLVFLAIATGYGRLYDRMYGGLVIEKGEK